MQNNEIVTTTGNDVFQLPQEVLVKYGWIVLVTPIAKHLIDKVYNWAMAKEVMANNYELSTNPDSSVVSLKKGIVANS